MAKSLTPTQMKHLNRKRKVIGFFVAMLAATVVYQLGRAAILLRHGREIAQHSASFKRNYLVGKPTDKTLTYLVLGDSTAAGWGAKSAEETYVCKVAQAVAARGFRVRVVNVAVGGARLRDVLATQIAALKTNRPQIVTVSVGANDATHGTDDIEYSNDLKTLFAALKTSGATKILVANTPDMFQTPALVWPLARKFGGRAQTQNAIFDTLISDTRIQKVDLFGKGKLVYARDQNLYARDLFHPSSKGYRVWAREFVRVLDVRSFSDKRVANSRFPLSARMPSFLDPRLKR